MGSYSRPEVPVGRLKNRSKKEVNRRRQTADIPNREAGKQMGPEKKNAYEIELILAMGDDIG